MPLAARLLPPNWQLVRVSVASSLALGSPLEFESLSDTQAARLAAILPDPKGRSASRPSDFVVRRARGIADGAALIRKDGRAACFES